MANNTANTTSTLPLKLMKQHRITVKLVANSAGVSEYLARRVLNPVESGEVSYSIVKQVRRKVHEALALFDHHIPPDELWAEYEPDFKDAA